MKLVTAIINPGDLDEVFNAIQESISPEDVVFGNIKVSEGQNKGYTYRGKAVNDSPLTDRLEVRCYVNKNNEKSVPELLARFSRPVRSVDLEEAWEISTITNLDHHGVLIGFIVPVRDDLVTPLHKEILREGYEVETLASLPHHTDAVSRYDALVIDMSVRQ